MAIAALLTPDDLIQISARDGKRYELSEGRLIDVGNAGYLHEVLKSQIATILISHLSGRSLGRVFSESMFALAPHTARIPDVAYVRREKISAAEVNNEAMPFAPDIAIEVISESESAFEIETKLQEYLTGGVLEIWQVFPNLSCVVISDARGRRTYDGDESLRSAVLPELVVPTSELFKF